jgi:Uma2 family endonuclease
MKVRVAATGLYTYPDVIVACGDLNFADDHKDVLLNPLVLVEVLSPTTAAYGCGPKAVHYRLLESLQDFLLIDQGVPFVEHFHREDAETWRVVRHEGLAARIDIQSIGCQLALAEIYVKVELSPTARPLLWPPRVVEPF